MPETDDDGDLFRRFAEEFKALAARAGTIVVLELTALEAWALLATIQLALRHPENVGGTATIARELAGLLERAVATTPALAEVARRGWDPHYDG